MFFSLLQMKVNTYILRETTTLAKLRGLRWGVGSAAFVLLALTLSAWTNQALASRPCPPLLNHSLPRLQDEQPQNLCQFSGRVVLAVNTASACGFTPQYEGLQKLHQRYASSGLVVMGFPSEDFRQEPKDNKAIAEFCFDTYGVQFPMFAKSDVVGQTANPFFAALARQAGQAPTWNFHKYLIDREGRVVESFPSAVEPLDRRLVSRIEQLLAGR